MKFFCIVCFFAFNPILMLSQCNYYYYVNKAEVSICDKNLEKAVEYYDSAFINLDTIPYYKDAYNAFVVSVDLQNEQKVLEFWKNLCTLGIDSAFMYESSTFNSLSEKKFWNNLVLDIKKYKYPKLEYLSELQKIMDMDQSVRMWCKLKGPDIYKLCTDTIRNVDSINYQNLLNFRRKNGAFLENVCVKGIPGETPIYYLILEHNAQWKRLWAADFLIQDIKNTKFHPLFYSKLMDYYINTHTPESSDLYFGTNYHAIVKGRLFIFPPSESIEKRINNRRKSICLESMEDYHKKLKFQFFNPHKYYFIYGALFGTLDVDEEVSVILFDKWQNAEIKKD